MATNEAEIRIHGMKGDKVEIVIDAGGTTRTYEVAATRAGRRVEVVNRRGLVEVAELTRGGTPVRTARFMASRVIALVEHPATRSRAGGRGAVTAAGPAD
jgi:hypothetical protein